MVFEAWHFIWLRQNSSCVLTITLPLTIGGKGLTCTFHSVTRTKLTFSAEQHCNFLTNYSIFKTLGVHTFCMYRNTRWLRGSHGIQFYQSLRLARVVAKSMMMPRATGDDHNMTCDARKWFYWWERACPSSLHIQLTLNAQGNTCETNLWTRS